MSQADVEEAEARLGAFPPEYRSFVRAWGSVTVRHHAVFGLGAKVDDTMHVVRETEWERTSAAKALPAHLIAVRNDGGGNIYSVAVDGTVGPMDRDAVFAWWHDDDSGPEKVSP